MPEVPVSAFALVHGVCLADLTRDRHNKHTYGEARCDTHNKHTYGDKNGTMSVTVTMCSHHAAWHHAAWPRNLHTGSVSSHRQRTVWTSGRRDATRS